MKYRGVIILTSPGTKPDYAYTPIRDNKEEVKKFNDAFVVGHTELLARLQMLGGNFQVTVESLSDDFGGD